MNNRLEIKGKQNALNVAFILLESGYSVHFPYMANENENEEERYVIIEYSFVKYGSEPFTIVEEDL